MKCVQWRERFGSEIKIGWCIEVYRNKEVTAAQTLCGNFVLFPSWTEDREPTCEECLERLRKNGLPT